MTKELIESIIYHVTEYKTLDEYLQSENMTADEFTEAVENGYIQDITCGTYNGASDTFDPWRLTPENVVETVRIDMLETDFLNNYCYDDILQSDSSIADQLEDYVSIFTIFTIESGVYINRD